MNIYYIILGIIVIVIGVFVAAWYDVTEEGVISTIVVFLIIAAIGALLIREGCCASPTEEDVLKGKAIYKENIIIHNVDTIKTYDIIWKE